MPIYDAENKTDRRNGAEISTLAITDSDYMYRISQLNNPFMSGEPKTKNWRN